MPSTAPALPDVRLAASWAATLREFGAAYADPAAVPDGRVPCTSFWALDGDVGAGDEVVGFLAVRHGLNDLLLEQGGHIGDSVRPSARRRGHAASRRTSERAGGVLEDVRAGTQRFWVEAA